MVGGIYGVDLYYAGRAVRVVRVVRGVTNG